MKRAVYGISRRLGGPRDWWGPIASTHGIAQMLFDKAGLDVRLVRDISPSKMTDETTLEIVGFNPRLIKTLLDMSDKAMCEEIAVMVDERLKEL